MHCVDSLAPLSKCYHCGGTRHNPSECRFKYVIIEKKRDHIQRACMSKGTQSQQGEKERAKWVEAESSEPDLDSKEE